MNRPSHCRDKRRSALYYESKADELLKGYGLKYGFINSPPVPFEIIAEKYLGLTFHIVDIKTELGLDSLAAIVPDLKLLLVDASCAGTPMYSFTVCHEIAHYRMHGGSSVSLSSQGKLLLTAHGDHPRLRRKIEILDREADRFAAAFLMPRDLLVPQAHARGTNQLDDPDSGKAKEVIAALAELFDVSKTAMRYRLQDLGLLTRSQPAVVSIDP